MIDELRREIAEIEKNLEDKKKELREAVLNDEVKKISSFLHSCCQIKSRSSIAYLINVSDIDIDDYDSNFITIEAEKVIVIETDIACVNLDETSYIFDWSSDTIEAITEEKIWESIGQDIKAIL